MAVFSAIFVLVFYFSLNSGYILIDEEQDELVFAPEYHFKCDKFNFGTTVKQTSEVWYSAERNRSRISYYDGTTQKFYYGDEDMLYTIYPEVISTSMISEMVCTSKIYRSGQYDFMPEVDGLTNSDLTVEILGKVVNVWKGETQDEGKFVETILYVSKDDEDFDIPVQMIVKKYILERGELISHVVFNYYNYDTFVTDEDLTLNKETMPHCYYGGELGEDFKTDIKMLHPDEPYDVEIAFDSYVKHHNKAYFEKERKLRKSIFEKNWRMVHEHNQKNLSYKLEINDLSDKTPEELKYLRGTFVPKHEVVGALPFPHTEAELDEMEEQLPEHFDLRLEGAVSGVKNQGECGSCWAFASTAAMEGALSKINGNKLLDLSEQSLIDCAWRHDNLGCEGGTLDGVMKYLLEYGIPTEREYGLYLEQDGICKINNMTTVYKTNGFVLVTPRNPTAMKAALYKYGPVVVSIHASDLMMHYHSGVFYDFTCEDESPNHAITVVGYGVHDGEDYWLVKNSYGEKWGEGGYILFSARNNNCLLLDNAYYPVV